MEDYVKTKIQLLDELTTVRKGMARLTQRVADLEAAAAVHQQTEEQLQLMSAERFFQVVLSISNHIYVTEVTEDGGRRISIYPDVETNAIPEQFGGHWSSGHHKHPSDDRAAAAVQQPVARVEQ